MTFMPSNNITDGTHYTLKRLRFQSAHRGCKETDYILGRFCEKYLDKLSPEQLETYDALLREEDADLYRWYTRQIEVPERLVNNDVFKMLMAFDVYEAL